MEATLIGGLIGFGASVVPHLLEFFKVWFYHRYPPSGQMGMAALSLGNGFSSNPYASDDPKLRFWEHVRASVRPIVNYGFFGFFLFINLFAFRHGLFVEGSSVFQVLRQRLKALKPLPATRPAADSQPPRADLHRGHRELPVGAGPRAHGFTLGLVSLRDQRRSYLSCGASGLLAGGLFVGRDAWRQRVIRFVEAIDEFGRQRLLLVDVSIELVEQLLEMWREPARPGRPTTACPIAWI
jgi:hypothetical protein